jgi:hypothetical protein
LSATGSIGRRWVPRVQSRGRPRCRTCTPR